MQDRIDQLLNSASEALREGNEDSAIHILSQVVDAGDSRGAECLGYLFEAKGKVNSKFYEDSYNWYVKSIETGEFPSAHKGLGRHYYFGYAGKKNWTRSEEHLLKAHPESDPQVSLMLAEIKLDNGRSPAELEEAYQLFRFAAASGYPAGRLGIARVARARNQFLLYVTSKWAAAVSSIWLALRNRHDPRLFGIGSLGTIE